MKTIFTLFFVIAGMTLLAQSGALDAGFNSNGKYRDTKGYYRYGQIAFEKVVIQPDGKILMAANNGATNLDVQNVILERLNTNGTPDATFGTGGRLIIDLSHAPMTDARTTLGGIAVQPDGKIIVATTTVDDSPAYIDSLKTSNVSDIAVARLNTDGSFDATFNSTGKLYLDFSKLVRKANSTTNKSYDNCNAVVLRPNGKIVLGGTIFNNNNTSTQYAGGDNDALLVQLNANGTPDASFSGDGVQLFAKAGTYEIATDTKLQADGKIVWSGYNQSGSPSVDVLVLRANIAGALDKTFATNGFAQTDIGSNTNDYPYSSAIQADGKILISGYRVFRVSSPDSTDAFLVRYQSNGSADATFGNGGKVITTNKTGEINDGRGVAVQSDGKIIQVGYNYRAFSNYQAFEGLYNYQVLRFKTSGKPDSTFGSYGRSLVELETWFPQTSGITSDPTSRYDRAYSCAIQTDGKIVVTGKSSLTYVEQNGGGDGGSAVRMLATGNNYAITAPADHSANLTSGCTASFSDIDPKVYPDTSLSIVKYRLYKAAQNFPGGYALTDSGYGSLSNKPIGLGSYTVVYSSVIDSNQRAYFKITVTGGAPGGALDFDGTDDKVSLVNNGLFIGDNHAYTFEAWIKVRGYNPQGSVVFSNQHYDDSGIVVGISPKGFISTYQPKKGNVISSYKVQLNTWTHIAFVQNSQKLDLYVNGVFAQTLLTAPFLHANVYNGIYPRTAAYFGATSSDDATFSKFFNGDIDNARFWQRPLCQAQLQSSLNCTFATNINYPNGPYLEFNFDRGLAGCQNAGITTLVASNGNSLQVNGNLQNFYLDGPQSNWVEGLHKDTCGQPQTISISYVPNITLYALPGACGAVANFAATATSPCDSARVTYSANPGTLFPAGITNVQATAQDVTGSTATANFTVTVNDTIPPSLQTKDTTVRLDKNSYAYIIPTAVIASLTDNCSSQAAPTYTVYPTSFTATGTYTVTVVAKDKYNNTTTKYATITVLPYKGAFTGSTNALIASNSRVALQANELAVKVSPNPSREQFTMAVQSNSNTKFSVTITDLAGKVIETFSNVNTNQSLQFGASYHAGSYLAVIHSGSNRKVYKLVKL